MTENSNSKDYFKSDEYLRAKELQEKNLRLIKEEAKPVSGFQHRCAALFTSQLATNVATEALGESIRGEEDSPQKP